MKLYLSLVLAALFSFQALNAQKKEKPQSFKQLNKLARSYFHKQNYDSAKFYAQKALIQCEKELGKDTNYCWCLASLFEISYVKGEYKQCLEYLLEEQPLRIKLQGEKSEQYLSALNNQAATYEKLGNFTASEDLYLKSLEFRKKIYGIKNADYANTLNNLALLYEKMGNYSSAESLFTEAVKTQKELYGAKDERYIAYLGGLGMLYKKMGNFASAEPIYLEVLQAKKEIFGSKHPEYALLLNNLAVLYKTMGNSEAAEPLQLETIQILKETVGEKHNDYASALGNLASLYKSTGKLKEAETLQLEALRIRKEVLGVEHPEYAASLNGLSATYMLMRNYAAAESLQLEAIQIRKKVLGVNHPDYATSLNNLAELYYAMGNNKASEPPQAEALKIYKTVLGEKHPLYIRTLNNYAGLFLAMQDYSNAEPLFLAGIKALEENIFQNFSFLSEKEKELYFKTHAKSFSRFYAFSLCRKKENPNITEATYNTLLTNKGLLLKSSTGMRTAILGSNDTVLIFKYKQWVMLREEISKINSTEVSKRKKDPHVLEQQANSLEKDLVKRSSQMKEFQNLQNITWKEVQKNLKKGEAAVEFIDFFKGRSNDSVIYCALLIKPESKYPEMIELFEEHELRKILGNKPETNFSYVSGVYGNRKKPNTKLYELIWKPMEKNLKGVKTIYYSPSGLLHKISFASLGDGKDHFLCDSYYLNLESSSGKITLSENFGSPDQTSAIIFGDIKYDTPVSLKDTTALITWTYLDGTKTESEHIAAIFKEKNLNYNYLAGSNANEEAFKIKSPNNNIIHIATHGFFFPDPDLITNAEKKDSTNSETWMFRSGNKTQGVTNFILNKNPLMRSGLVFAGANEVWINAKSNAKEDGVLTAQEVANIDLRKTNLVVLSACETGLGDIKGTEGVYGLQRAFKMAGVKYLIMSLWQVPDAETVEFMTLFYSKLTQNKDVKKSFSETQKLMRKKYDPFYWAAFALIE